MPQVSVTRRYTFTAAHRLHSPLLSDEENRAVYGKCNNPLGHGHDYEVELTVRGEVEPVTGRVINLQMLDELIENEVLARYRYTDLNRVMKDIPTTENLAGEIDGLLRSLWPAGSQARIEKVRIRETPRNICDVVDVNG